MADTSQLQPQANDDLIRTALSLYIHKTREENRENRSWIKQPNNFISAVALMLSLVAIGYQVWKDTSDGIDANLAAVSKIATELTQLDYEQNSTNTAGNLLTTIENRRLVLVSELNRLINDLGKNASRIPAAEMAAVSAAYFDLGDVDSAVKYLRPLASPPSSPLQQINALRSIGNFYAAEGPNEAAKARDAFAQAENVKLPRPSDAYSVNEYLLVEESWALFESSIGNAEVALDHFAQAQELIDQLECFQSGPAAARLAVEARPALEKLAKPGADPAVQAWNKATRGNPCLLSPAPTVIAAPPRSSASELPALAKSPAAVTTKCKFYTGNSAGKTINYAYLGVGPIPVGTKCTDGNGGVGIAVP